MPKKRRLPIPPYPVVLIDWIDSRSERGWTYVDELEGGAATCQSAGFLIRRTKHYVTVSDAVHTDGDFATQVHKGMSIPTVCVRRLRVLLPGVKIKKGR